MFTTTLGAFLNCGAPEHEDPYYIYVIRNGGDVLYVGRSVEIMERTLAHLGESAYYVPPDRVGCYVLENLPESLDWTIGLYSLPDCESVTGKAPLKYAVDAERAMIYHLEPLLNRSSGRIHKPIPAYYKRPFEETPEATEILRGMVRKYGKGPLDVE